MPKVTESLITRHTDLLFARSCFCLVFWGGKPNYLNLP